LSPTAILFNEPWLSIRWNSELRCVHAEYKAFATSAEFRSGTMAILEAIRAKRSAALVSDNRRLELVTSDDQSWVRDTWTPEAAQAGLQRIAVVLPHHGLGKFASQAILSQMSEAIFTTKTFSSPDDAMAWVGEHNN
jgi:hypothetical protein